ncbi:MAG: hypothetical protein V1744_05870 [Candidatus Altiarchaeota archaeon]
MPELEGLSSLDDIPKIEKVAASDPGNARLQAQADSLALSIISEKGGSEYYSKVKSIIEKNQRNPFLRNLGEHALGEMTPRVLRELETEVCRQIDAGATEFKLPEGTELKKWVEERMPSVVAPWQTVYTTNGIPIDSDIPSIGDVFKKYESRMSDSGTKELMKQEIHQGRLLFERVIESGRIDVVHLLQRTPQDVASTLREVKRNDPGALRGFTGFGLHWHPVKGIGHYVPLGFPGILQRAVHGLETPPGGISVGVYPNGLSVPNNMVVDIHELGHHVESMRPELLKKYKEMREQDIKNRMAKAGEDKASQAAEFNKMRREFLGFHGDTDTWGNRANLALGKLDGQVLSENFAEDYMQWQIYTTYKRRLDDAKLKGFTSGDVLKAERELDQAIKAAGWRNPVDNPAIQFFDREITNRPAPVGDVYSPVAGPVQRQTFTGAGIMGAAVPSGFMGVETPAPTRLSAQQMPSELATLVASNEVRAKSALDDGCRIHGEKPGVERCKAYEAAVDDLKYQRMIEMLKAMKPEELARIGVDPSKAGSDMKSRAEWWSGLSEKEQEKEQKALKKSFKGSSYEKQFEADRNQLSIQAVSGRLTTTEVVEAEMNKRLGGKASDTIGELGSASFAAASEEQMKAARARTQEELRKELDRLREDGHISGYKAENIEKFMFGYTDDKGEHRGYVDIMMGAAKENAAGGATFDDVYNSVRNDMRRLVYQDELSLERSLGDHGVRHILDGNCGTTMQILESKDRQQPGFLTDTDRAMALMIQLNHDMGYTTDMARYGFTGTEDHPQFSTILFQEGSDRDLRGRVFGEQNREAMARVIATHSSAEVDFSTENKEKFIASTVRLSDNLGLFADTKLPEAIYKNSQGFESLMRIEKARQLHEKGVLDERQLGVVVQAERDKMKAALRRERHKGEKLTDTELKALDRAIDEFDTLSPTFILGQISGRLEGVSLQADGTASVQISQTEFQKMLRNVFGDDKIAAAQFKKFVKDYAGETELKKLEKDLEAGRQHTILLKKGEGPGIELKFTPAAEAEAQKEVTPQRTQEWEPSEEHMRRMRGLSQKLDYAQKLLADTESKLNALLIRQNLGVKEAQAITDNGNITNQDERRRRLSVYAEQALKFDGTDKKVTAQSISIELTKRHILSHPDISDEERIGLAVRLVGPLSEPQKTAILDAHRMDGVIDKITPEELRRKVEATKDILTPEQRRTLIEAGIMGIAIVPKAGITEVAQIPPEEAVTSPEQIKRQLSGVLSPDSIKTIDGLVKKLQDDPEAMLLLKRALEASEVSKSDARNAVLTYLGVKPASVIGWNASIGPSLYGNVDPAYYPPLSDPNKLTPDELYSTYLDFMRIRSKKEKGKEYKVEVLPPIGELAKKLCELNPDLICRQERGYLVNGRPLLEFDPRIMQHGLRGEMPKTIEEGFVRAWFSPRNVINEYKTALYLGFGPSAGKEYDWRQFPREHFKSSFDTKFGEGAFEQMYAGENRELILSIANCYAFDPAKLPKYASYAPNMILPKNVDEEHFMRIGLTSQYASNIIGGGLPSDALTGIDPHPIGLSLTLRDLNPFVEDSPIPPKLRGRIVAVMLNDLVGADKVSPEFTNLLGKTETATGEERRLNKEVFDRMIVQMFEKPTAVATPETPVTDVLGWAQLRKGLPSELATWVEEKDVGKVKEYFKSHSDVSNPVRRAAAEGLLGRTLNDREWEAVLAAHNKPGVIDQATSRELWDKHRAMSPTLKAEREMREKTRNAGVSINEIKEQALKEIKLLMDAGIAGHAPAQKMPSEPAPITPTTQAHIANAEAKYNKLREGGTLNNIVSGGTLRLHIGEMFIDGRGHRFVLIGDDKNGDPILRDAENEKASGFSLPDVLDHKPSIFRLKDPSAFTTEDLNSVRDSIGEITKDLERMFDGVKLDTEKNPSAVPRLVAVHKAISSLPESHHRLPTIKEVTFEPPAWDEKVGWFQDGHLQLKSTLEGEEEVQAGFFHEYGHAFQANFCPDKSEEFKWFSKKFSKLINHLKRKDFFAGRFGRFTHEYPGLGDGRADESSRSSHELYAELYKQHAMGEQDELQKHIDGLQSPDARRIYTELNGYMAEKFKNPQYTIMPSELAPLVAAKDVGKVKEYFKTHADVSDPVRRAAAEGLLGRTLNEREWEALLAAHNKPGVIDQLTSGELLQKHRAVSPTFKEERQKREETRNAGVSIQEIREEALKEIKLLMDAGIAGHATVTEAEVQKREAELKLPVDVLEKLRNTSGSHKDRIKLVDAVEDLRLLRVKDDEIYKIMFGDAKDLKELLSRLVKMEASSRESAIESASRVVDEDQARFEEEKYAKEVGALRRRQIAERLRSQLAKGETDKIRKIEKRVMEEESYAQIVDYVVGKVNRHKQMVEEIRRRGGSVGDLRTGEDMAVDNLADGRFNDIVGELDRLSSMIQGRYYAALSGGTQDKKGD